MMPDDFILLEDRAKGSLPYPGLWFEHPVDKVVCEDPALLSIALARLDEIRKKGFYLVGFLSYEAGYVLHALEHAVVDGQGALPLLYFLVFKTCVRLSASEVEDKLKHMTLGKQCGIEGLRLGIDEAAYHAAFDAVQAHLQSGNTYQVNLSSSYYFKYIGSPLKLYHALRDRQKVSYSAFFQFGQASLLSLSPELFFSKKGDHIVTKPMKGTMPRSRDPRQDDAYKAFLTTDLKSIAENIMIVDLLRNDLSMIARTGTVHVSDLLHVESYESVHQMVSTVACEVDAALPFLDIIRALFPCGSITGAPKRRTMEIIRDLETRPRGLYTGTLGYITPDNDMCFNVMIRTLHMKDGPGEMGVGGGLLVDSVASQEFEEMRLKGRFFTGMDGV
ncbi:MAG: aminodeoxychorismate synthase component I [Legionellaceae bacterium]